MDNFIDKLQENKILTKEDILLLKRNINEDHPHLDKTSKAHILARSIHNTLNQNLQGFTKDHKSNIKTYLIKSTFLRNKESIFQYDVLKACALTQDTSLEFIYQVTKWISKQTDEEIPLDAIKNIIKELDIEDNSIEDEISLSKALEEKDESPNLTEPIPEEATADINTPIDNKDCSEIDDDLEDQNSFDDSDNQLEVHNDFENQESLLTEDNSEEIPTESDDLKQYLLKFRNKVKKTIHTVITDERYKKYILIYSLLICLLIVPVTHIVKIYIDKRNDTLIEIVSSLEYDEYIIDSAKSEEIVISEEILIMTSHLPDYLKYKEINKEGLQNYLTERNSLLSSEPYFTTIIDCSKQFNINPILLFSIAGHEQAFVPMDNTYAEKIANNPYNVFQSWKKYNKNIEDSSKIVCRTIINLLKDKPEKEDPFKWINRKYAEDKNWWKGVRSIFYMLEEKTK